MTAIVEPLSNGFDPSALVDISTVCNRYLLQVEASKGAVSAETLAGISATRAQPGPPPYHQWPDVLRKIAVKIAESRMRESEPREALAYDEFVLESQRLRAAVRHDGKGKRRAVGHEVERRRAVFLSRWFPVPKPAPRIWSYKCPNALTTWSRAEMRLIVASLLQRIETENPVEPAWYPDGWRESAARLGGA